MNKIHSKVWNKELGQLVVASEFAKSDSAGVVQGEGGTAPVTRSLLAVVFASLFAVAGYGPAAFAQEWAVTDGATVGFQGDSNINVSVMPNGADATVEINLDPDLVVDSVTTGDTVMNNAGVAVGANVVLGTSGLSITDGPSVTLAGIDAGNTVITNVAAGGNASDAVNFGQLQGVESSALAAANAASEAQSTADNALTAAGNAQTTADAAVAAAGAGWDVSADSGSTANIGSGGSVAFSGDSNISVAQSGDDDAGAIDITLNPDLNVSSVTAGNTTVNNDGLTITGGPSVTASGLDAGGTKLTGLANGTVSADSTDAITGQQLHNVLFEGGSAFGVRYFRANSTADDAVAAGVEAVAIGPNTRAEGDSSFAAGDGAATTETGEGAIAVGQGATAGGEQTGGAAAIAIGRESVARGSRAVALGDQAQAGGGNATALGAGAVANGGSGVAVGDGAFAAATHNISIGAQAGQGTVGNLAGDWTNNIAIGAQAGQNVEGQRNVAMGSSAGSGADGNDNVSLGENAGGGRTGDSNISIGRNANVGGNTERGIGIGENARAATDGVAIGYGAHAAGVNGMALGRDAVAQGSGVALGQGSRADSGYVALGVGSAALATDVAGSSAFTNRPANTAAVSVGNTATGQTRRIVNVEDGASDTDAVNVRQLKAAVAGIDLGDIDFADGVIANLQDQIDNSLSHYVSINDGSTQTGNWANDGAVAAMSVAIGPDASTTPGATNATAIGSDVTAQGSSSVVLGHDVQAQSANSVAIGSARTEARDVSGVAVGTDSQSRGMNSIVIGTRSESDDQDGNNVQNSIVIGTESRSTAREGIVIGRDSLVNAPRGMAQGDNAQATAADAMASGTRSRASGTSSQASGTDAHATGTNAIATGTSSRGHATNGVAVGTGAVSGFVAITPEDALRNHGSIAIGDTSRADDLNAMALGVEAQARAESATAIGDSAVATEDAEDGLAVGSSARVTAQNASAFGRGAEAVAEDALAVGSGARAAGQSASAVGHGAEASAANASAFGQGASALHEGSVALGSGAQTAAAVGTASYTVDKNTYNFAGTAPVATVSVGAPGQERTITNVAAGRISAQSTDAINGSQLYSTNQAVDALADDLDTAGASVAAALGGTSTYNPATHTVTAGLSVQGNNYTNVQEALTYVGQGWNVSAEGGATANVAPGGSVDFSSDDGNIVVSRGGTNLVFDLDDEITIGESLSFVDGDTFIDGDSVTTTNLTVEGETRLGDNFVVNNAGDVTYNGAEIATQDDGLAFAGNTGGTISKTLGDNTPLTISGGLGATEASTGANLRVDSDGNQLNLVMARDLTDLDSITINNGPVISNTGIDMGDTRITNLAAGEAGTDAVNVSQLEAVEAIANAGWNVLDAAGNEANIGPDGELTFVAGNENLVVGLSDDTDDAGVMEITLADNIQLSEDGSIAIGDGTDGSTLDAEGLAVVDGDNATTVGAGDISVTDGTGTTAIGGSEISVGGDNPIVISGDAGTIGGLTNTTFDPNATYTGGLAATQEQLSQVHGDLTTAGLNFVGDDGLGVHRDLGQELSVTGGADLDALSSGNIGVTRNADGDGLVVELADNIELTDDGSITIGDTFIDGDEIVTNHLTVGGTTQLGDHFTVNQDGVYYDGPITEGDHIVNKTYVDGEIDELANTPLTFAGDAGTDVERRLGETVNLVGGATDEAALTDGNIGVVADGTDTLEVKLNKDIDLGADGSLAIGDATLDTDGLDVDDGAGNSTAIGAGTIAVTDGTGTTTIGGSVVSVGGANPIVISGETGTIGGLTNLTFDPDNIVSGQAATEDQLGQVYDVANAGWNVSAQGENTTNVGVNSPTGNAVDLNNDDGNIVVTKAADSNDVTFDLADDITVDSVTAGNSVLDTDGLVVTDADGNVTTVAANGTTVQDDDGNVTTVAADGTTVNDGAGNSTAIGAGTIAVTDGTGTTTIGGSVVSVGGANPIVISGDTGTIGGLANQTIDYTGFADGSGRAATEEQLDLVNQTANAGWNLSGSGEDQVNIGPNGAVDFQGDQNISIAQTGTDQDGVIEVTLNRDLDVDSVTAGDTFIDTTGVAIGADVHLGNTGLVIAGGPSVTVTGINAGNLVITNVAPGEISATSTDAINGSQLHGMGDSIVNVIGGNAALNPDGTITTSDIGGTGHDNIDDAIRAANDAANAGWTATDADGNAANIGPDGSVAFTGDGNINVAQTGDDNSGRIEVTLNRDLDVDSVTAGNTVIDTDGVQVGENVHLGDTGLVIEGGPSVTTDGIDAGGQVISNVAAGVADTDAANVGQIRQVAADVVDLGDRMDVVEGDVADLQAGASGPFQVSQEAPLVPPTPTGANSAAGGSGADASGDNATALGNQAVASGDNSTAVGQGAQATHDNSVALGQGSATTVGAQSGYDAAYVGSSSSAGEVNVGNRTVSGVAPGVVGTDAVNVNQLQAGVNHAVVTANAYTDQRFNQVQNDVWHLHGRVDELEKDINAGVATAMAMRQAPYVAGATTYYAGFGAYKDQGALGVSLRRTADNGRWSLEGGFSANRDGAGGYIGVSGVLGSK